MTTTTATGTNTAVKYVLLSNRLSDLVKVYNRHRAWHDVIDAYGLYRAAGLSSEAEAIRGTKRPPSKTSKYDMYGYAGNVRQLLADVGIEVARPETLDAIGWLIDEARKALDAAPKNYGSV